MIFGQSLIILIVVARATERLALLRTLWYVFAGCSCLKQAGIQASKSKQATACFRQLQPADRYQSVRTEENEEDYVTTLLNDAASQAKKQHGYICFYLHFWLYCRDGNSKVGTFFNLYLLHIFVFHIVVMI